MGWMPVDTATRYAMGLPTLLESQAQANREYEEAEGGRKRQSAAAISAQEAASAERRAEIAADAQNQSRGQFYNQGGAVYKHAHPTYMKFGKTGDSSLLAKGRK